MRFGPVFINPVTNGRGEAASIKEHANEKKQLPASKDYLKYYSQAQADDALCTQLKQYCLNGWPSRNKVEGDLLHY